MRILIAGLAASLFMAMPLNAQGEPTYQNVGEATGEIADAYLAAYMGLDWDRLEGLLSEEASFKDETATLVFGEVTSIGRDAMMKRYREGYASITYMKFLPMRRMVSGHVAVFEGTLDWGINLGDDRIVTSQTPMVIVLTVRDGKVVKHRDYVDYAPFIAAIQASRAE